MNVNLGVIAKVITFLLTITVISFTWLDFFKQKKDVDYKRKRSEHAELSIEKSISDGIKTKRFLKQKNLGIDPKLLNKNIKLVNHAEGCSTIIPKKGI